MPAGELVDTVGLADEMPEWEGMTADEKMQREAVVKLNKMDWSFENPIFFKLLVTGTAKKKMITGKESIKAASQVIAYIVMGADMTKTEVNEVKDIILNAS